MKLLLEKICQSTTYGLWKLRPISKNANKYWATHREQKE